MWSLEENAEKDYYEDGLLQTRVPRDQFYLFTTCFCNQFFAIHSIEFLGDIFSTLYNFLIDIKQLVH